MSASIVAPEPVVLPVTVPDDGRSPASPLDLRPTPSQLARSERAAAHAGVSARGLRFRWSGEAARPDVEGTEFLAELTADADPAAGAASPAG